MKELYKARMFKIAGASLAYLPMLVLLSGKLTGFPANGAVLTGCAIFNLPALSLSRVIQTYQVSHSVQILCDLVLMLSLIFCRHWIQNVLFSQYYLFVGICVCLAIFILSSFCLFQCLTTMNMVTIY